jgi:hypothetical protein
VQLTRDAGKTWTNVTAAIPKLPEWGSVKGIDASPTEGGTAYVVVDAHRMDDAQPYLWKTSDYGKTWKSLAGGLASDVYLHAVRIDPRKKGVLYVGTERGVMVSRDDGSTWESLQLNLPTVAVHDLMVKDDALVLGTHGRSIWILDDLTAVRELTPALRAKGLHLFAPPPVIQWRYRGSFHEEGPGENPKPGLTVQYWLKEKPEGEVTLELLDAGGAVVRSLSSKAVEPEIPADDPDSWEAEKKAPLKKGKGVQVGTWDLAADAPRKIQKARIDSGSIDSGPSVLPGTYTLRLSAAGESATATVEVRPDPRVTMTSEERRQPFDCAASVAAAVTRVSTAVEDLRSVRTQLGARSELVKVKNADWAKAASDLVPRLDALEDRLHNPKAKVTYDILAMKGGTRLYSRLVWTYTLATWGDGVPTLGMRELFAEQTKELDALAAEWKTLLGDVAALNERAKGFDYLAVPTAQ